MYFIILFLLSGISHVTRYDDCCDWRMNGAASSLLAISDLAWLWELSDDVADDEVWWVVQIKRW